MASRLRGRRGHGQLGTGSQMVPTTERWARKDDCWEKKGPADTGKTLAREQQGERGKKPDKHTETLAKSSTRAAHWASPGRKEMKAPCKPTSGHLIRKTVPKGIS